MNSRDIFINNLKAIMKERKVSRRQLAEGLNIPYTTLTDWCTGRIFPRVEKINLIADYFNLKKSDLIEEITDEDDNALYDDVVKIDVFSKLFLDSVWCLKNESFKIDEELIPPEWIKNHQSYFGLIMNDNSMDPEFHKDDCLIIRECKKMDKDGFYCVLEKDSDYAKIRKLIHINDGIMVMPLNMSDNTQPKTYLKGTLEFEALRIIGIVVQVKRKYI
jgi:repressor LexA